MKKSKRVKEKAGLKLDIGCGTNKKEGFFGIDVRPFKGVDLVLNVGTKKWPFKDNSVEEAFCAHMIEHLEWPERIHFFNELYRVMKKDATAQIILPHWCSNRYYGDPTHKAPFSEMGWFYLKKEWRKTNAPHVDADQTDDGFGYSCDFDAVWHYSMAPWLVGRSADYINDALTKYKEAAQDMIGNLKKIG